MGTELHQLEHLSLVSKLCTELDNHLGINDKDLAEFIIALADKHSTLPAFQRVLEQNGAEFPASLTANLLRIIQLMRPAADAAQTPAAAAEQADPAKVRQRERSQLVPALAMKNQPAVRTMLAEEVGDAGWPDGAGRGFFVSLHLAYIRKLWVSSIPAS